MDGTSALKRGRLRSLVEFVKQQLATHLALVRFVLVGGTGYLLYQSILFLVYDSQLVRILPAKDTSADLLIFEHGDARLLIATVVASALTIIVVFTGHNFWTFRGASVGKPLWLRFGQFVPTVSVGAVIVIVTVNVLAVQFDMHHLVALPIGVLFAGTWDWLWYSRIIWRRAKR